MTGTVLANEEIINGLSERGNHPVIRQPLRQWILKITQYADKLEEGLGDLQWPEGTLSAQKQWIGRSVGASIKFNVENTDSTIEVFTTRPDTIMGVTYVVLAPEHPLVSKLTSPENKEVVDRYIKEVVGKSDMERTSTGIDRGKTGVPLGAFAVHPITGEKVFLHPVFSFAWIDVKSMRGEINGTALNSLVTCGTFRGLDSLHAVKTKRNH